MKYTKKECDIIYFFKKYESLTKRELKDIACYIMGFPYSWGICFIEIVHKTDIGKKMIKEIAKTKTRCKF